MCFGIGMRNLQFRTFLLFYCNYYYLLLNAQFDLYSVGPTDCCVKCYTAYMVDSIRMQTPDLQVITKYAKHQTRKLYTDVPMYQNGCTEMDQ